MLYLLRARIRTGACFRITAVAENVRDCIINDNSIETNSMVIFTRAIVTHAVECKDSV